MTPSRVRFVKTMTLLMSIPSSFLSLSALKYTQALHQLAQKTLLAHEYGAAALHRFMNAPEHLFSLSLHQRYPGSRGSGLRIVPRTPVRHFRQDRDKIQTFFGQ